MSEEGNNAQVEPQPEPTPQITREWLVENTNLKGWVDLFRYGIFFVGTDEFLSSLLENGSYGTSFTSLELAYGTVSLALSIVILVAFERRNSDAVFLSKAFLNINCVYFLILLWLGRDDSYFAFPTVSGLVMCALLYAFVLTSEKLNVVIPEEYRRQSVRGWVFAGVMAVLIGLAFVPPFSQSYAISNEVQTTEHTDGIVSFTLSGKYWREEKKARGFKVFQFRGRTAYITIFSGTDPDSSKAHFDDAWEGYESEEYKKYKYHGVVIKDEERTVNGNKYFHKVKGYREFRHGTYWHFIVIYDKDSNRVCIINVYSKNNKDRYLMELLESIRFVEG